MFVVISPHSLYLNTALALNFEIFFSYFHLKFMVMIRKILLAGSLQIKNEIMQLNCIIWIGWWKNEILSDLGIYPSNNVIECCSYKSIWLTWFFHPVFLLLAVLSHIKVLWMQCPSVYHHKQHTSNQLKLVEYLRIEHLAGMLLYSTMNHLSLMIF